MKINLNQIRLRNKMYKNVLLLGKNNYFFPKITFLILLSIIVVGFIACEKIIINENTGNLQSENMSKIEQLKLENNFDDILLNTDIEVELIYSECRNILIETIIDSNISCNTMAIKPKVSIKNKSILIEQQVNSKPKIQTIPFLDLTKRNEKCSNNDHKHKYLTKYKIYVYTPYIKNISIIGNGKITSKTKFATVYTSIKLDGNGQINLDINSENLNILSRGNGQINLLGNTQNLDMNVIGNNQIDFSKLNLSNSNVVLGGNSDIKINVINKLKIDIFGNSNVKLIQNPKILESDITGNGLIRD